MRLGARVVVVLVAVVLVVAAGVGARLWWVYPLKRSVDLPAGVEQGVVLELAVSAAPRCATTGCLGAEYLRSEGHEWVGNLKWSRTDPGTGEPTGDSQTYEMRLGETVRVPGLGTVTLLAVNPPPLRDLVDPHFVYVGGRTHQVNVVLDPGVVFEVERPR